jgi:hypothetical protein
LHTAESANPLQPDAVSPGAAVRRRWIVAATAAGLLGWTIVALFFLVHPSPRARSDAGFGIGLAVGFISAILALIPAVRDRVAGLVDLTRHPSPRTRRRVALVIAVLSSLYLFWTESRQGRDFYAKEQDESMYLIQSQMLARGRLWMPAHAHADFFESFHVFVKPKYAPIYFPGTALLYAPHVWLHLPAWVISLAIAGAAVGMTYRVLSELIDGAAGWMGALLLLDCVFFRRLSIMVMSHTAMLLLGLLMVWAWLRWREEARLRYAVLLGLFAGWAAITRPVDALCYALPMMAMMLWDLRRWPWPWRVSTIVAGIIAAAPLLALQLVFDRQVTGQWLKTPVTAYHEHYFPQERFGLAGSVDTADRPPPTPLPQFRDYYENFIRPQLVDYHRLGPIRMTLLVRLPLLLLMALPSTILLVFVLPAMTARSDRRGWALILTAPLLLAGYALFIQYRKHYGIPVLPGVFCLVLLGAEALRRSLPPIASRTAVAFTSLLIVGLAAANLPQFNRSIDDQVNAAPFLYDFDRMLARLPHKPALVFVRHHSETPNSWSDEPVYNTDVAWPDDATVIRAHDLGERNQELIDYYARVSPGRWVYRYDKSTRELTLLGRAGVQ